MTMKFYLPAFVLCCALAPASTITFNYTTAPEVRNTGLNWSNPTSIFTNSITIADSSGLYRIVATGFSATDSTTTNFQNSRLNNWNGGGLGVCNQVELTSNSGCSASGSPSEHRVDNAGMHDYVLFKLQTLTAPDTWASLPVSNIVINIGSFEGEWDVS